ncbi:methylated-DNA--[protein]-cysteine S-methyltransferase [Aliikangiella sp. G2MR2-5]|uniref:methylated-DNA--[protein]-cysteine S-methyltransferase n=1 Tax=Aliikangiella sp. G2MR2-5 TaxID=2788943 RepID=UPI0018ABB314|nr:methylated-DNA--[protein]-cysteine S-methyltransferase [Aliikangiella sp. G2MR2-5]
MHETAVIETPVGKLKISIQQNCLYEITLNTELSESPPITRMGKRVVDQLADYFRSAGNSFQIPLVPRGTEFQTRVWIALCDIPPGKTETYGELAARIGSNARAVGNACRRNPTPIVVPCHRVVAQKGLGGYAGDTGGELMNIKRWLLSHEGIDLSRI